MEENKDCGIDPDLFMSTFKVILFSVSQLKWLSHMCELSKQKWVERFK